MTPSQRSMLMSGSSVTPQYVAVSLNVTPFITFYKRLGDKLNKLAAPATLPPSNTFLNNNIAVDNTGTYVAIASGTTPFVTVYKRTNDTFTKLTNPGTLPTHPCRSCQFSNTGLYLLVGADDSTIVNTWVYTIAGTTVTYNNALSTGSASVDSYSFSPDDSLLFVGRNASDTNGACFETYSFNGTTFTLVSSFNVIGMGAGVDIPSVAISPDGNFAAAAGGGSPYIVFFSRSGTTLTKLTNPTTLPNARAYGVAWSPDSLYCAVGYSTSPYLIVYKNIGGVFTPLTVPVTAPTGTVTGLQYTADNQYLVISTTATPYIGMYKHNGDTLTWDTTAPSALPVGQANGMVLFK